LRQGQNQPEALSWGLAILLAHVTPGSPDHHLETLKIAFCLLDRVPAIIKVKSNHVDEKKVFARAVIVLEYRRAPGILADNIP
jgi:hypothetical protein